MRPEASRTGGDGRENGGVRDRTVLVAGAAGFVGQHLIRRLLDDGAVVEAAVRPGGDRSGLDRIEGLRVHELDVTDPDAVEALFRSLHPNYVVNATRAQGESSAQQRRRTLRTALIGTSTLLEAAAATGSRRLVQLGTSTEYGPASEPLAEDRVSAPRTLYGAAKAAATVLCQAAAASGRLPTVVLRPFAVYGPGDHPGRLIPRAIAAAAMGAELPLTAPGLRRDWVYVGDVVDACLLALDGGADGEVVNVATGVQHANEEVVELIERAAGRPVRRRVGAEPERAWDRSDWVGTTEKAERLLGWRAATPLGEGIRITVDAELKRTAGALPVAR